MKKRIQLFHNGKVVKTGSLVGTGFIGLHQPVYLISLDDGFYDPEKNIFVSILAVDMECDDLVIDL